MKNKLNNFLMYLGTVARLYPWLIFLVIFFGGYIAFRSYEIHTIRKTLKEVKHEVEIAPSPVARANSNDKNCSDFTSYQEAQDFFTKSGQNDPHNLDSDGDNEACEGLK